GENDLILMGMVKDVTAAFTDRYLAGLLGVIQSTNQDAQGKPLPEAQRLLRLGPAEFRRAPGRCARATARLLAQSGFWRLVAWVVANALDDLAAVPGRLVPAAWLARYAALPAGLRPFARFAERRLRALRWTYLRINLVLQLELTRAQIPLQRLGKA